jgi:hypothetical protein
MTFNQWAAGKNLDTSARLAFEAVWREMVDRGSSQAPSLLTDLFESIPEFEPVDEEDLF